MATLGRTYETRHDTANIGGDAEEMSDSRGVDELILSKTSGT